MKYKSNIQRLNESRKAYQDILSERITDGQKKPSPPKPPRPQDWEKMNIDTLDIPSDTELTSDQEMISCDDCDGGDPISFMVLASDGCPPGTIISGTGNPCEGSENPPNPSAYNEITLEPCPNNTSVGGFTSYTSPGMTIGGNTPTVGMVANLDTNPLSTFTGNWEVTAVNQTSQTCNHPSNVGGICNFDVGSCEGSTPCDFPTISATCAITADLVNQFANNNPSQFLSNMATWYANPPGPNDGCHFLEVVRQKHLGHLASGIVINSNNPVPGVQMGPVWIAQKAAKVVYLDCVLADLAAQGCCSGTGSGNVVRPDQGGHDSFNALEQ